MLPNDPAARFPPAVHEHEAAWQIVEGRLEAARDVLDAVRATATWTGNLRIHGRVLAMLGDIHRQLGEMSRAAAVLDEAEELQVPNGYEGDLADFTWHRRGRRWFTSAGDWIPNVRANAMIDALSGLNYPRAL